MIMNMVIARLTQLFIFSTQHTSGELALKITTRKNKLRKPTEPIYRELLQLLQQRKEFELLARLMTLKKEYAGYFYLITQTIQTNSHQPPLIVVAYENNFTKIAAILLTTSMQLINALEYAVRHKKYACAQLLLKQKASYNSILDITYLLHLTIEMNNITSFELILNNIHEIDKPDSSNQTALMVACKTGSYFFFNTLLEKSNINCFDNKGNTPLHHAVINYDPKDNERSLIIRKLIRAGARTDIKNIYDESPQDIAREKNCLSLLKINTAHIKRNFFTPKIPNQIPAYVDCEIRYQLSPVSS